MHAQGRGIESWPGQTKVIEEKQVVKVSFSIEWMSWVLGDCTVCQRVWHPKEPYFTAQWP